MAKELTKTELRDWMERYHDLWIDAHNKLMEINQLSQPAVREATK